MSDRLDVRLLKSGDERVLDRVGDDLFDETIDAGRARGCAQAWVLTERDNIPAMRTYASIEGAQIPSDHVMITIMLDGSAK